MSKNPDSLVCWARFFFESLTVNAVFMDVFGSQQVSTFELLFVELDYPFPYYILRQLFRANDWGPNSEYSTDLQLTGI